MLRDFLVSTLRALRACLSLVAGAAVVALSGCGIKGPLMLPPATPPAAAAPSPPAAPVATSATEAADAAAAPSRQP